MCRVRRRRAMPMLDSKKLVGNVGGAWVRGTPTKTTSKGDEYRCPACAQGGGDAGGQHLIVFKDRATFACAAYPNDLNHRRIIWNLAGDKNKGRPEPIVPRKVEQKNTFIGKHVMDMEKLAKEVRERDADLVAARKEREAEAKRLAKVTIKETQHIDAKCDKERFGTFGTVILSSANMPPPPNKETTIINHGGGYAPMTYEKASQTSQVRPTMPMGASPMPEGYCRTCWNKWGKMVREYEDIGCEICAAKEAVLV
jgi:hypothetical protein